MKKERKHYAAEEKVAILRRHLVEQAPVSPEDARRLVEGYVEHCNNVRLNSAIGYITPTDMLTGRQQEIQAERPTNHPELDPPLPTPASLAGSPTLTGGASGDLATSALLDNSGFPNEIMEMVTYGPVFTFRLTLTDLC